MQSSVFDRPVRPASSFSARVTLFLCLTWLFSTPWWILLAKYKMFSHPYLVLGLMWSPGMAGLLTGLLCRVSFREFGWRWPRWRWIAAGYFIPIGYSMLAYSFLWITGLGHLQRPHLTGPGQMLWMPMWLDFPFLTVTSVLPLVFKAGPWALGEEIGWSGFLVPTLASRLSFTKTSLITGTIWAVWHLPFLLTGGYKGETPWWYSFLCFYVMIVSTEFLWVWLRLRSKSLWPCVLLHAMHNLWIQVFLTPRTGDTGHTRWWVDEFGAALAIVCFVMGFYIWWRQRNLLWKSEAQQDSAILAKAVGS